jgi:LacI family transcriptional regulator
MNLTMQDIASELGLSKMTVSRALNNRPGVKSHTHARVHEFARMVGYKPDILARGMVTGRTYVLALVIPELMHTYYGEIAVGVEEALDEQDYNLILCHSHADPKRERRILESLMSRKVDAIILAPMWEPDSKPLYLKIRSLGIPLVILNDRDLGFPVHYVCTDNMMATQMATSHMLSLGYDRIALLSGWNLDNAPPLSIAGYNSCLDEAGVGWRKVVEAGWTEECGYQGMVTLLKEAPDTRAVVCANDYVAIGALEALRAAGKRVPEEIAVIGKDDISFAQYVWSPLTTIAVQKRAMGKIAAEICLNSLADPERPLQRVILTPSLVVRSSCGAALIPPDGLTTQSSSVLSSPDERKGG